MLAAVVGGGGLAYGGAALAAGGQRVAADTLLACREAGA